MSSTTPLIMVKDLKKWFPIKSGFFASLRRKPQLYVRAVDGVSFSIRKGEFFALAGESGCGKTTTGRTILRLIEPTDGKIFFDGVDVTFLEQKDLRKYRRKAQIIFQDPYESLNPRMTVFDIVAEPLKVNRLVESEEEARNAVIKGLEEVEIKPPEDFLYRFPHELSGGQRQRVAIARVLVLNPKFIVADEPVSMLDMSLRASILDLMESLREKYGIAYLYITHDLSVAKYVSDRIAIMYLGKIVETGSSETVITHPIHPYSQALISAVPVLDPRIKIGEVPIKGEVPTPINIPRGCRFHPRCLYATEKCRKEKPILMEVDDRLVSCHYAEKFM